MTWCMRTTITLDDGLARDVRRRAAKLGISVSALIERTLRDALMRSAAREAPRPFRLVTVGGGGLQPGIDLERAAKLVEAEDAEALARAGR
jgi:hypothetical protein